MSGSTHSGKVVLITGAGSGMGRATALRFADEGAERISLVDRRADPLAEVAAEVKQRSSTAQVIVADLSDIDECRRAVTEAAGASDGRLDVVVSNAGAVTVVPFLELQDADWDQVIAVNLTASFAIGQSAAQVMAEGGRGGVILFTVSIDAGGGDATEAHYAASKAGTANLVKTMALELAPHNIRVNSIWPGPTETPLADSEVGREWADQFRRETMPWIPLQRYAKPEDIAAGFSFLASDDASYITGIDLTVDGGLTARAFPSGMNTPAG